MQQKALMSNNGASTRAHTVIVINAGCSGGEAIRARFGGPDLLDRRTITNGDGEMDSFSEFAGYASIACWLGAQLPSV